MDDVGGTYGMSRVSFTKPTRIIGWICTIGFASLCLFLRIDDHNHNHNRHIFLTHIFFWPMVRDEYFVQPDGVLAPLFREGRPKLY